MKTAALALVAIVAFPLLAHAAEDDTLGGPGESCRARADCKRGLKCLAAVCIDEHDGESCGATSDCGTLKCIDKICVNPSASHAHPPVVVEHPTTTTQTPTPQVDEPIGGGHDVNAEEPPSHASQDWLRFELKGVHPFVGFTVGFGFLNGGYTGSQGSLWGNGVDGAFLFALRGGVLINHHELAVEISPFTDFWDLRVAPGPAFQFNVSYGYLIPLIPRPTAGISWPIRVGVGIFAGGTNTNSNVFFEGRADLIGVAFNTGHVIIELHAPSFRYALTNGHVEGVAVEGVSTHYLSFFFGTSVSYAF